MVIIRKIIDLGCGEGILEELLSSLKIFESIESYDLVSTKSHIKVADIKSLPLEDKSIDLAVFCLSLMGTNYLEFIVEALRVLKLNGRIMISEVISRFRSVHLFNQMMEQLGLKVEYTV